MRSLTTDGVYLTIINSRIVIMAIMITFLKPLISFLSVISHLLTSVRGSRGTHPTTFLWQNYYIIFSIKTSIYIGVFYSLYFLQVLFMNINV